LRIIFQPQKNIQGVYIKPVDVSIQDIQLLVYMMYIPHQYSDINPRKNGYVKLYWQSYIFPQRTSNQRQVFMKFDSKTPSRKLQFHTQTIKTCLNLSHS